MRKTKSAPKSQLFLFSKKFNKLIENWFPGSLIIEYDLLESDLSSFPELYRCAELVKDFIDEGLSKATVVINYNEKGLLFTKLDNTYSVICRLNGIKDVKKLNQIYDAWEVYGDRQNDIEQYLFDTEKIMRFLKNADFSGKQVNAKEEKLNSKIINQSQELSEAIKAHFKKSFVY